jgi:hypothetical protein
MAGDWIKFELATLDKPEVFLIADLIDCDPDAVIGKLMRVWGWFDQQTEDGNAPSVTKKLLDRLAGVIGFADAMKSTGWLMEADGVISLPHFDRHNGKTAKNRLLAARRAAKFKAGNAESNAGGVTPPLKERDLDLEKELEKKRALKTLARQSEEQFDVFYAAYPNHKGRVKALAAWMKVNPDCSQTAAIMAGLARYIASAEWARDGGRFIPHPTTWLNQQRWNDEVTPYEAGAETRPGNRVSAVDQVRQSIRDRDAASQPAETGAATLGRAVAEDDGVVRPPLDGEFWRDS